MIVFTPVTWAVNWKVIIGIPDATVVDVPLILPVCNYQFEQPELE